ncbi:MAG TPA: histidine kinase, partial [Caulobacteraceae bacterium]|nr:histidine kinase [Caulobacteraceae bacterium]
MRLPSLFRTTPFRLTLIFLALFAGAASAFLAYIYGVTVLEVTRIADASITREVQSLEGVYSIGGREALRRTMQERTQGDRPFLYLLEDASGHRIWGTIPRGSVARFDDRNTD